MALLYIFPQLLIDEDYNISVTMVKQSSEESGVGGDWAVRLSASRVPGRGAPRKRISLVMYLGDEGIPKAPGWDVMPDGEVTLGKCGWYDEKYGVWHEKCGVQGMGGLRSLDSTDVFC